jgi:hypothetical protein
VEADLDTLATALYVRTDDLLKAAAPRSVASEGRTVPEYHRCCTGHVQARDSLRLGRPCKLGDEVECGWNAGGDSGRGDDGTLFDPSPTRHPPHGRPAVSEGGDARPVAGGVHTVEDSRAAEHDGSCAHAEHSRPIVVLGGHPGPARLLGAVRRLAESRHHDQVRPEDGVCVHVGEGVGRHEEPGRLPQARGGRQRRRRTRGKRESSRRCRRVRAGRWRRSPLLRRRMPRRAGDRAAQRRGRPRSRHGRGPSGPGHGCWGRSVEAMGSDERAGDEHACEGQRAQQDGPEGPEESAAAATRTPLESGHLAQLFSWGWRGLAVSGRPAACWYGPSG